MDITPYAIPAVLALLAKAIIYLYARFSDVRNLETRLYLFFLFALSIQNLAEITFFTAQAKGLTAPPGGVLYFVASIVAIAILLHLALALSSDRIGFKKSPVTLTAVYAPALILEVILLTTPWLVSGFEPLNYTYTKVPGPLYFLFEIYALGYLSAVVVLLFYGSIRGSSALKRIKNRLMLVGLIPIFLVVATVISLQHYGMRAFNTTVTLPIAITFFLAVTAYATHQHRLFDIAFYIPWSKVRARKTAFYDRIRTMIAEIADLGSVREATHRLSETLGCSVALVSAGKPVLAAAGGAQQMVAFSLEQLRSIDRIVVANEIADSSPETYRIMRSHGVAAVVPFYPHSQSASGWMLLGDNFSEQVYTPLDFKMVEQLFDKMAELFLDKLLTMRGQLATAERRLQTMEFRLQEAETGIAALRSENETLQQQNLRLAREQAADSLLASDAPRSGTLPNIVLLGRDKPLLKRLRHFFPQADQYVGPGSASFRRQSLPDVLICRVDTDKDTHARWLTLIAELRGRAALLLHGEGTREFIAAHLDAFAGTLVEVMPEGAADEAIVRRVQALAGLRRTMCAVTDPNCPLVGVSQVFHDAMQDAARLANFAEPVLIESQDAAECVAVARYLHDTGGRSGRFQVTSAAHDPEQWAALFAACRNGTLLFTNAETLDAESRERLLAIITTTTDVRVILAVAAADEPLRAHFRSFTLRLPTLRERRQDLLLMVHYFTLQYNLRAGTHAYLTQVEVDELMATHYPNDTNALKTTLYDLLHAKHRQAPRAPEIGRLLGEKTLDEQVAAFEAHLIEQTLKRCQGNKSKAARLLGLRPNTLHYKLERYGLGGNPKEKPGNG